MAGGRFGGGGQRRGGPVCTRLQVTTGEASHELALDGAGIAMKSIWDVAGDLRSGALLPVLEDYPLPAAPLHAIWLSGRHQPPRVRLFSERLREHRAHSWQHF